jgi:hypothetical protein
MGDIMPGLISTTHRAAPHLRSSLLAAPLQRAPLRLQLSPEIGRMPVDGAWWPYGHDLAVEVLDLVMQFPPTLGRLSWVVYSPSDWGLNRRRGIQADEALVSIRSFRRNNPHMVMLRSVSPRVSRVVRLVVVPPEWEERAALYAMRTAANPSTTATGSAILDESLDLLLAGRLPYGDGSGVGPSTSAAGPLR